MAPAWVDMCHPSATSAIEPKIVPAVISITIQVWRSFLSWLSLRNTWSWGLARRAAASVIWDRS